MIKQPVGQDSITKHSQPHLGRVCVSVCVCFVLVCCASWGWALLCSNGTENNIHARTSTHVAGWHVDTWHCAITPPDFRPCPPALLLGVWLVWVRLGPPLPNGWVGALFVYFFECLPLNHRPSSVHPRGRWVGGAGRRCAQSSPPPALCRKWDTAFEH